MSISLKRDSAENINAIEKKDEQILIETDKGKDNKIYYDDKLGSGDIVRCTYGGFLTVDDKLNDTSKNPVENRVINTAFHETQNKVDIVRNELKSISDDMFDLRDTIKGSKILWQRNEVNDSNGVVTNEYKLKERISQQQSGILIIFSRMEKTPVDNANNTNLAKKYTPKNYWFICEYIPKTIVPIMGEGRGYSFNLFGDNRFNFTGTSLRYVYIYDDKLVDNKDNFTYPKYGLGDETPLPPPKWYGNFGTNGIQYATDFYCIRYILGV